MSTLSLRVKYRPIRIGWCLRRGNWDQFRSALRLTHSFAGGRFNPLIPVDAPDLAEDLLDRFRVDVLFPLEETEEIAGFIKSHDYLRWPEGGKPQLFHERWEDRPAYGAIVDVYHVARRIREEDIGEGPEPPFRGTLYTWEENDPLRDVLLATVGAYPAPSAEVPDYPSLFTRALKAETVALRPDDPLPADINTRLTPSRLSTEELTLEGGGRTAEPGVYFGSANDFTDLLNFWNVRACGIELVFFDPQHGGRLGQMLDEHKRWLATLPPKPWREGGEIAVWGQNRLEGQDLSVIGPRTMRHGVDEVIWNGLNIEPARPCWEEQSVLGSVDESGATPSVTFALPEKPTYDVREFFQQYIGVSVSGFDRFTRDRNVTFFPPFLPDLNEYYGRELYYHYAQARAEYGLVGGAIGLLVPAHTSDITLRALPSLQLTTRLFGKFGITAKPSQAGLVTSRLIAQMGGIQDCRVFKIEGVRTLIAKYRPEQHFDRTRANKLIGNFDEATGQMRFEPFQDLFIAPREYRRKLQPQDALDQLLERGVFRVGLELKCSNCGLAFWQPLDDVKTKVECQYCGKVFDITTQLRDRSWAYRRSGLFGRDDHQHGGIPVAVTLQQLDTDLSSHGMLYTTCLELTASGAAVDTCETDFVVITSGYSHHQRHLPQVVVGECKAAGGEITPDDADHLAKIADALPRRRVSAFVVFAKTGGFSDAEIDACARAQARWHERVILLSKDELEPYDIFERHPGADRMMKAQGLEGLAQFTTQRFPRLRPEGFRNVGA